MTFLELEKRCKKRRVLKLLKYFVLFVLICIGLFFYKTGTKKEKKTVVATNVQKEIKNNVQNLSEKKKVKIENKEKNVTKKSDKDDKLTLMIDLNITEPEENNVSKTKRNAGSGIKKTATEIKSPFVMTAKTLPSYETCIALAKKYYQNGDYKEALKWATNANTQDVKKPDSWIMSAKALYKLGKKQQALKILEIYYNYHKDEKVKRVMGELNENN